MKSCHICQSRIPLVNEGEMVISNIDDSNVLQLMDRMKEIGVDSQFTYQKLHIYYFTWKQLQRCTSIIQSMLSDEQLDRFMGVLQETSHSGFEPTQEYTLSQLSLIIENPNFVKIIQEQLFQSYMQPIITTQDNDVFGYEFLLRPSSDKYSFSPGNLFLFSQHTNLQSTLDSKARMNAIKTGKQHLSKGLKQFINFLPSSIYDPAHCLQTTFEVVKEYDVNPSDLIFEVVETEKIHSLDHLKNIFSSYKQAGMKVALDDIGSGFSTIEMLKELRPDYAKIDRDLIRNCHESSAKMEKIKQLRHITKEMGTSLLAEGIETEEEFNAVRPLVDLAQGYYFGKPMNKPIQQKKKVT
ncbi:EAL domain-containing protein [Salipaludibacillus daqingensis]|uniref:EAL domain-containing protein n=1 Tax=Salipaludibacillus daqingensis TaxID=3041001 RepID=UPI0024751D16|nr:EAL domain-containing protein [Salipaludibacillus daqingensis]